MDTGSTEHKAAYKAQEIKRLTESAWSNMITATHMGKAITELTELRAKAAGEVEGKQKELEVLPHGKENREKRATLTKEIGMGERGLKHVDQRMQMLVEQIETHKDVARRELARANTIETQFPALLEENKTEA